MWSRPLAKSPQQLVGDRIGDKTGAAYHHHGVSGLGALDLRIDLASRADVRHRAL